MKRYAFSLIELSIVLVILGLLVGGILAGQSLIHAAELRKTSADFQRYQTAINAFRDKYLALPGDMTNATIFWGTFADPDCVSNTVLRTNNAIQAGTCNGDGDSKIGASAPNMETYRFWQHLQFAGLIENVYLGTRAFGSYAIAGVNIPAGRFSGTGYSYSWVDTMPWLSWYKVNANIMLLGRLNYTNAIGVEGAGISPEDAWSIDKKIDDGLPYNGNLLGAQGTYNSGSCYTGNEYTYTNTGPACFIGYKM